MAWQLKQTISELYIGRIEFIWSEYLYIQLYIKYVASVNNSLFNIKAAEFSVCFIKTLLLENRQHKHAYIISEV